MKKIISIALAVIFCLAVFSGCSGTSAETENTDTSVLYEETSYTTEPLIGEVCFVSDSSLSVYVYNTDDDISEPEKIDISALTTDNETADILISSDAVRNQAIDGEIYTGYIDEIEVGTLIAVNYSDDGTQIITVLGKIDDESETENTDAEFADDIVGSVISTDNGDITIDVFSSPSYLITDYISADFTTYESVGETVSYTPNDNTVFKLADNGTLLDAYMSDVLVGDMVIIGTDENGNDTVIIYHTDASDEEEPAAEEGETEEEE